MRTIFMSFVVAVILLSSFAAPLDSLPELPKTNVEIPWTELKSLLELSMMKSVQPAYPPVAYMIPAGNYETAISDNVLRGTASFSIIALREGYIQVPLFDVDLPLRNPELNGAIAPITPQNGKHTLIIKGPGHFRFSTGFVMELKEHVSNFRLNIPHTSSAGFKLTLPGANLDVKLTPASRMSKSNVGGKTVVQAYIPSTDYLFCEWMHEIHEEAAEEVEPVLYAEVQSLFSVGEGMVKGFCEISYSVVQGKIDVLRFEVPKDVRILSVTSSNLRDWKMEEKGKARLVNAYLKFPTGGTINIDCRMEKTMKAVSATVDLPVVKCLAVERGKGYIGIEATTNVEVSLITDALDVATRIDRSELPQSLWHRAKHPIILAFKYLETPYKIALEIEKHEDLPVKVATADDASFVALLTRDGNYIVRGTYNVRNNLKQFLTLMLPDEAELWSLFVNGKPAKPGKGNENSVLIPMEKSRGGQDATTFPIEIIYFVDGKKLGSFGSSKIALPKVDVPISVMNLSLYLPYGYTYTGFGGNMDEEESWAVYGSGGKGFFDESAAPSNVAMKKEKSAKMGRMMESQVAYEEEMQQVVQTFSSTDKGVFPVRISIPEVGTLHRFQKYVIAEDAEAPYPVVKVRYTKQGIKTFLAFIVLLLSIIIFVFFARHAFNFFTKLLKKEKDTKSPATKALIIGIVGFVILFLLSGTLSVSKLIVILPWILGVLIVGAYMFIKLLTGGYKTSSE